MNIFCKKTHGKTLMPIVAAAVTIVMMLTLTACDDDDSEQKTEPTQEATVATDTTGTEANNPAAEPTGSAGGGSSAGGSSSGSASAGDIGAEKVKLIVLAKVPGATAANIAELEREHDDGRLIYEGSVYYNGYEYEFEVDGATGNLLKWEIDD